MVSEALDFIRLQLNEHIKNQSMDMVNFPVVLKSLIDDKGAQSSGDDQIYMTLVKIEEENHVNKQPHFMKTGDGTAYNKLEPPVMINLLILISATHKQYATALKAISFVIMYFQKYKVFEANEYPTINAGFGPNSSLFIEKMIVDLQTLPMEQHNNMWASLGAKYLPSVLYKIRMITFLDQNGRPNAPIVEISGKGKVI